MDYSFDIFDTVITRITATPEGIFSLMEKKMQEDAVFSELDCVFISHFTEARVDAEKLARIQCKKEGKKEIIIDDIYKMLSYINNLDGYYQEKIMRMEERTEYECALPVRDNIDRIERLLEERHRVFLISDIYLGNETICAVLEKCGIDLSSVEVILSCEWGLTKRDGDLYGAFISRYGINPDEWIHTGDNPVSDVMNVKRHGGRGLLYKKGLYRNLLFNTQGGAERQLILGVRKYYYRNDQNDAYKTGMELGGPLLYAYVHWVISDAVKKNIKRLCFIARDGYLPETIANEIITARGYDIKTSYLYGSRLSWKLPVKYIDKEGMRDWIREDCAFHTLREFASHFMLSENEIKNMIEVLPFKCEPDTRLSIAEMLRYINYFSCNDAFLELCLERFDAAGRRDRARQYLRQETGSLDDGIAFVELKGSGETQKCLFELAEKERDIQPTTYFFIISHTVSIEDSPCRFKSFIHAFQNDIDYNIIEALSRAPHGQTIDYSYSDDDKRWEPVLSQTDADVPDKEAFNEYFNGVMDYTRLLNSYRLDYADYYGECVRILKSVCDNKESEYMSYFGDMPFEAGWSSDKNRCFSPKLSDNEVIMLGLDRKVYNLWEWYDGGNIAMSEHRMTEEQQIVYAALKEKYDHHLNDYPDILKGVRLEGDIILYGAGKRGKELYEGLKRKSNVRIVLWVDRDYLRLREDGLIVDSPETIISCKYDMILIAIEDHNTSYEVRKSLIKLGADNGKIV